MTQNNFDYEDEQAIFLANSSSRKKYIIDKKESYKYKKVKKLKIVNKARFVLAIGTITLCISGLTMGISSIKNANVNINNSKAIVSMNDTQKDILEQDYIEKYCNIYGINSNIAYQIAAKYSGNFSSQNYLQSNNPIYQIDNKNYDNKELGFLCFVRHLYQMPEDFNVNNNEIKDTSFSPNENIKEEMIVKHYSDLFNIDPALVLAIEYQEASNNGIRYSSDVYMSYNNPAGLISPTTNQLWQFPSKEAGIVEHVFQLKKYYIDKGLTTPEQIKGVYAPNGVDNDPNNLNVCWLDNVKNFMKEIKNNPNIFNENMTNTNIKS